MKRGLFLFFLLRMAITDKRSGRIPQKDCLAMLILGIAIHLREPPVLLTRLVTGTVFLLLGALLYRLSAGKGLGGGDIKWIAALAVVLGGWDTLRGLLIAFSLALLTRGLGGVLFARSSRFALGPYLAAGACAVCFFRTC